MSVAVIRYNGNAESARETARNLVAILSGRTAGPDNVIARGVWLSLGFAALSDIRADFVRKARGATGEDGVQWPRLSRKYLAYGRRFGKNEQAALKRAAGLGKKHRFAPGNNKGLLTKAQLQYWRSIYGSRLARFMVSMPERDAKAKAAAIAWNAVKAIGGRTKLEVFGNRQVEILRDTSVLLNSISPGLLNPSGFYTKPGLPGAEHQICETIAGGVVIGTNVPYAATHQYGDTTRGIPARPFLPANPPAIWLNRWLSVTREAMIIAARMAYGGAA